MQTVDAGKRKCWSPGGIILGFFAALVLSYSLLVAALYAVCYLTPGYFEHEYEKYGVLSNLPEMTMSDEDGLMAVTKHMMHYLTHGQEPEELQIEVRMGGELRGFFSEREIAHMADVRDLFVIGIRFFAFGIIIAILLMLISRLVVCQYEPKIFRISTGIGLMLGTAAAAVALGILGHHVITHFDTDFITFHHMFFDNDLWLLDPAEDMLINIVPEGFFFDTVLRTVIYYAVLMLAMFGAGMALVVRGRKLPDYDYAAF